jgi:tetratricopeptide (TPR) repeat protein
MRHLAIILALLITVSCQENKPTKKDLGVVNMSVSGDQKAVPYFEKGLLLLHSFEYDDARDAFKKAQDLDPKMPMAYWGEAMTYNHSLWGEQDYDKGSAVLAQLEKIDLPTHATELEQDFIKAIQILYQPETEKTERDIAYADFMKDMSKKYPANHEVAAFYAISLLGSVPEGRDDVLYGKGAMIAQGILNENPNHPGALHYLIHSYDDPNHAALALDAANAYAKVAPDASHALHMPSHIYVAMGMWDEVISSNINSYQASVNRMEEKKLDNDARGYHAYHWLEYGYLQKGNNEEAKQMVLDMNQFAAEKPSKRARVHLVFLKGTYLVGTNEWGGDIADIPVNVSDLNISVRSQYQFLEGMKAYHRNNVKQLDSVIKVMVNDAKRESFVAANGNAKLCSGISRDEANETDRIEAQIRQDQLQALAASLENNLSLAEDYFLKSIALEESISYSYGPPPIQKPTRELYADWLLAQNRNEAAAEQYELSLKSAPKRRLAVMGIDRAKQVQ